MRGCGVVVGFIACLLFSSSLLHAQNDTQAVEAIFGIDVHADRVSELRDRLKSMPAAERFEALSAWVFPDSGATRLRMAGEFTPVAPPPTSSYYSVSEQGGKLVSPVFDLLEVAQATKRLDALMKRVEELASDDLSHRRASSAMKALLHLQRGDSTAAQEQVHRLAELLRASEHPRYTVFWPEFLLASRAVERNHPAIVEELIEFLTASNKNQPWQLFPAGWQAHLAALLGQQRQREFVAESKSSSESLRLKDWFTTDLSSARTRGDGFPIPEWHRVDDTIRHVQGHHQDFLLLRQPLAGEFEIECEVSASIYDNCELLVGDRWFGPRINLREFTLYPLDDVAQTGRADPPFSKHDPWVRLRASVTENSITASINGYEVYREAVDSKRNPWLGLHCVAQHYGRIRDVRIAGSPRVLEEVNMSTSENLPGWFAYMQDTTAKRSEKWTFIQEERLGSHFVSSASSTTVGSNEEQLLQYFRPLIEDGAIEYDFYYEPGKKELHPALDRAVFLLEPDGVVLHWLTDGRFERSTIEPTNRTIEAKNRRGPAALPLRSHAWNHVRLSIKGDMLGLELNQTPIYERRLESNNNRKFGLFHYADKTQGQFRNCFMRGDWPKSIPIVREQELASNPALTLDEDLPKLKSVFKHDFVEKGLDLRFFTLVGRDPQNFSKTNEGLKAVRGFSRGNQAMLSPRFSIQGDFDITASFCLLNTDLGEKDCGVYVSALVRDDQEHMLRLTRVRNVLGRQMIRGLVSVPIEVGRRNISESGFADDSKAGRLRLTRRGNRVATLYADDDSKIFRQISAETITDRDIELGGLILGMVGAEGGQVDVVWQSLELRADKLTFHPGDDVQETRLLRVLNLETGKVRDLSGPDFGFSKIGSPEWSSDGKRILCDMNKTSTADSHVVVMNADGYDKKDLGLGCIPSFSPDGSQIVFSTPKLGVVTMNADGSNRTPLDRGGWSGKWSPDGKWIAYDSGGNITLYDVATKQRKVLFTGAAAERYSLIYWNFGWSHDSRSIGFKASLASGEAEEMAVVDIDKPGAYEILHAGRGFTSDVTWTPDNRRIVFAAKPPPTMIDRNPGKHSIASKPAGQTLSQLYTLTRGRPGSLELLEHQPKDLQCFDGAWSPDGKEIAFVSQRVAGNAEWVSAP